jgi:hypothetical protein
MDQMNGSTDRSFTQTNVGERGVSCWGGRKPLGTYLLTQDKQGQPITEQKGGSHRQKENNKKAHLNHSSKITATPNQEKGTQVLWR